MKDLEALRSIHQPVFSARIATQVSVIDQLPSQIREVIPYVPEDLINLSLAVNRPRVQQTYEVKQFVIAVQLLGWVHHQATLHYEP